MKPTDYNENYRNLILACTDEELANKYLERNNYTSEYVGMLIEELHVRGIPLEKLTSQEAASAFLITKKSDEELRDIYTDMEGFPENIRELAELEIKRRGISIDHIEKEKKQKDLHKGAAGKHIVAGYIFSILGGLIGLFIAIDYLSSKVHTNEGKFYKYNDETRKAGKGMLIIFVIVVILVIIANR
jgi:hypothetical protein